MATEKRLDAEEIPWLHRSAGSIRRVTDDHYRADATHADPDTGAHVNTTEAVISQT